MVELIKLEIEGFGKFDKKKTVDFKKGINFITGLNEAGKSTILEAILASLFKYNTSKIRPYFSWKNNDVCRVSLTYKIDKGETFRITSDYKNAIKKLEKISKGRTTEISATITKIHEYIKEHFGFDEQKVFENTTFIRQSQMAMLGESTTQNAVIRNKIKDMIEEVFAGTAEASATKSLKKIKKVEKDCRKEENELQEWLYELKNELEQAEENKEGISKDIIEHEEVNKTLSSKSEKLKKLKENKVLFDEKEVLLKEEENIDEKINQVDELIETLEGEDEEKVLTEQNKTSPIILMVIGGILCLTIIGAIIGIPLIIYGYKLMKKGETPEKTKTNFSEKISKYKMQKKEAINKKAVIDTKLEKYKLVKFTIDDFKDLEKLDEEVSGLKERKVELKTSISTTKKLVKSPEEIREDVDSTEQTIQELNEKAEEYGLAHRFLELAEMEVQHKFTPLIEKNSKLLLKETTGSKYSDIQIDESTLDIAIKAPEIKEFIPVEILSQGAKDQVYFTIRTTMSDLLSGDINIPLIFDDPFHNFDDIRLKKTISAIKKISKNKQIILISHRHYQKDFKDFADNVIEVK